ncbi:XRE family transcriptional regulator [Streptomyces sp. URMC 129]|uniref:helix-turn-helix domain-containing protein n=1 Tax=Streptomyces sp. URMC 129 TaxID=3423407 RepID=UPI003F1A4617
MNYAVKQALARAGLSVTDVAAQLQVDPKTVARWISGRIPHPRHRAALSKLVSASERDLWPAAVGHALRRPLAPTEIQAVYPHRWLVPSHAWRAFFSRAEKKIDVLVYSGLFLMEDASILRIFAEKAMSGVEVRLLFGDPESEQVAERGREGGIGDAMPARIRNALVLTKRISKTPGLDVRMHGATLYNSIFRSDAEFMINSHVLGHSAANSPVLHLRQSEGFSMSATYCESFERAWAESAPVAVH